MMRAALAVSVLSPLSILVAGSTGQAAPLTKNPVRAFLAGAQITLRRVYHSGEVVRYRVTNRLLVDGETTHGKPDCIDSSTLLVRERTEEVTPDGSAVISAELEDQAQAPHALLVLDSRGHTVDSALDSEQPKGDAHNWLADAQELVGVVFPSRPVKPAESWAIRDSMLSGQGVKVDARATLDGTGRVDGRDAVRIRISGDGTIAKAASRRVHYTAVAYIDPETGICLRLNASARSTSEGSSLRSVTFEQSITCLGVKQETIQPVDELSDEAEPSHGARGIGWIR